MNLSLLCDRWRTRLSTASPVEAAIYEACIRDVNMMASGELREPNRLDTVCHFKKHKGKSWQEVIAQDPVYADWCLANVQGFQLDTIAHAYLVEMQGGGGPDETIYDDLKYER